MDDLIKRQEVLKAIDLYILGKPLDREVEVRELLKLITKIYHMPSAQAEIPPYVAEIEAEYKKWVNVPYIRKPLAKALYEVWKKHDREDAERRTEQPEIIRCKDCKYSDENWRRVSVRWLPCMDMRTGSNWFCGSAERRTDDEG